MGQLTSAITRVASESSGNPSPIFSLHADMVNGSSLPIPKRATPPCLASSESSVGAKCKQGRNGGALYRLGLNPSTHDTYKPLPFGGKMKGAHTQPVPTWCVRIHIHKILAPDKVVKKKNDSVFDNKIYTRNMFYS